MIIICNILSCQWNSSSPTFFIISCPFWPSSHLTSCRCSSSSCHDEGIFSCHKLLPVTMKGIFSCHKPSLHSWYNCKTNCYKLEDILVSSSWSSRKNTAPKELIKQDNLHLRDKNSLLTLLLESNWSSIFFLQPFFIFSFLSTTQGRWSSFSASWWLWWSQYIYIHKNIYRENIQVFIIIT